MSARPQDLLSSLLVALAIPALACTSSGPGTTSSGAGNGSSNGAASTGSSGGAGQGTNASAGSSGTGGNLTGGTGTTGGTGQGTSGASSGGSTGGGPCIPTGNTACQPADGIPPGCWLNPQTSDQIMNGCTASPYDQSIPAPPPDGGEDLPEYDGGSFPLPSP